MAARLHPHFQFRPVIISDLAYISRWSAKAAGLSERWAARFTGILREPPEPAASLLHPMSWMAVSGKQRLLFLEAGIDDEVYAISAPGSLKNYRHALFIWSHSLKHLHKILPLQPFVINLFSPAGAECRALEKLGCYRMDAGYSFGDSYLCKRDANEDGENEYQAIEP